MVANGRRKMEPVTESVVGEVSCDIPLSYSQHLHEAGGRVIYVLDEAAARDCWTGGPRWKPRATI